jgi:hypothetical protein
MNFTELDAEIARITRCKRICEESPEFADLGAAIERRIATNMLPVMIELLCRTNGNERAAIARRYDALLALLSETFASRLGA